MMSAPICETPCGVGFLGILIGNKKYQGKKIRMIELDFEENPNITFEGLGSKNGR